MECERCGNKKLFFDEGFFCRNCQMDGNALGELRARVAELEAALKTNCADCGAAECAGCPFEALKGGAK